MLQKSNLYICQIKLDIIVMLVREPFLDPVLGYFHPAGHGVTLRYRSQAGLPCMVQVAPRVGAGCGD